MANIHGKVLKTFSYKGKQYSEGDEITMDAGHANKYERNDYVKLTREDLKKVEAVTKSDAVVQKSAPKTK